MVTCQARPHRAAVAAVLCALSSFITMAQPPDNLYALPIGGSDKPAYQIRAKVGELWDLRQGKRTSFDAMLDAMARAQFVYVGESHTTPEHHQLQADIIDALSKRGRQVFAGFEMFERSAQPSLNLWTYQMLDEAAFIEEVQWYFKWGFNYALYKPVFNVVRERRIPMVALNAPRALVSRIGRVGYEGLAPEERASIPPLGLKNKEHRLLFQALIGDTHGGSISDNMYSAQVLWDEYMADSAIRYWTSVPRASHAVFVALAGSGHVLYKQGINYRVDTRIAPRSVTVVGINAESVDQELTIGRSVADFVLITPPHEEPYPSVGVGIEKSDAGALRVRSTPFSKQGIILDLERGDIIVSVDNRTFADPHALLTHLADKRFGDTVTVVVERDGERKTISRTITR